eukprot:1648685-Amphidinium_carterae.1
MLSGRSIMVPAEHGLNAGYVLLMCGDKLGLADDGARPTMEVWDLSGEKVDDETEVQDWPSVQPLGEISEYQLLLRQ